MYWSRCSAKKGPPTHHVRAQSRQRLTRHGSFLPSGDELREEHNVLERAKPMPVGRKIALCCVLTLSICIGACGPTTLSQRDIHGLYEVKYPYGTEVLMVFEDGDYTQVFTGKDGTPIENKGKWILLGLNNRKLILHGALVVDDSTGHPASPPRKADWYLDIMGFPPNLRFEINPDLAFEFRKKETK